MPKIDLNKMNPVALAILTFTVLGIGVLVAKFIFPALQVAPVTDDIAAAGPQLDLIPILDGHKDEFAGYKITVPAGWNISYKLASTQNTNWKCLQSKDCQLLVLSHDADGAELTQAVFATPVGVVVSWQGEKKSVQQDQNFAGSTVQLTMEKYLTASVDDSAPTTEVSDAVLQAYGCNSGFLCFNAGPLSTDVDTNKQQISEFEGFLANVKLEKL